MRRGVQATTTFPAYGMARVAELIPSARNARTHSDAQVAQIAASIREFGFTSPILIDGAKGVIAGHGRLLAARQLGLTEVPTIELSHLSPTQRRAYMLADNRLALAAGWDDDLLRIELADLRDDGFDLTLTGFETAELDGLFADSATDAATGAADREEDAADELPPPRPPVSRHKARGIETEHPAVFPVALPEFLIRAYGDPGNVVYEPFGGGEGRGEAQSSTAR